MKLLLDRMVGNLASWLRILDADTVYDRDADDDRLLERARAEGRVLLTRDRGLAERARARGLEARLLGAGGVADWLADLHSSVGLPLEPRFERCSLCNGAPLRPAGPGDVAGKEYVPKSIREAAGGRGGLPSTGEGGTKSPPGVVTPRLPQGWACPDCGQIYWEGGHWRNIRRTLDEARRLSQD